MKIKDLFSSESFLYFPLISLFLIINFLSLVISTSFAISPTFPRQEISDGHNDFVDDKGILINNNLDAPLDYANSDEDYGPSTDISSVTYVSDGLSLNTTVWLSSVFDSDGKSNKLLDFDDLYLYLTIQNFTGQDMNLYRYANNIAQFSLNNSSTIRFTQMENMTINELPSVKITYHNQYTEHKGEIFIFYRDNYGYVVNFSAIESEFEKHLPMVQRMVDSFVFINYTGSDDLTYQNPKYGFNIKYPAEWDPEKSESSPTTIDEPFSFYLEIKNSSNANDGELGSLSVNVFNQTAENKTLFQTDQRLIDYYLSEASGIVNGFNISNATIDNNPTIRMDLSIKNNDEESDYRAAIWYTINNNKIYSIQYTANLTEFEKHLPMVQRMVDSFVFINYTGSDDLTYQNPKYGFNIKYPAEWEKNDEGYTYESIDGVESGQVIFFPRNGQSPNSFLDNFIFDEYYPTPANHDKRTYNMYIDIDSVYDKGVDYLVKISWNEDKKTWQEEIIEQSSSQKLYAVPMYRTLLTFNHYTNFYEKDKGYVKFFLPLKIFNFPSQYRMWIETSETFNMDNNFHTVKDVSNIVSIPPPEIKLSLNMPNEVRKGDTIEGEIQITSNSLINSEIQFVTNSTKDLNTDINPRTVSLLPSGVSTSSIHVTSGNDVEIRPYTIPITAIMKFPKISSNITVGGTSLNITNSESQNIIQYANFSLAILPPLSPTDYLNSISTNVSAINVIWTFLAGVGAVVASLLVRKKQKEKKE